MSEEIIAPKEKKKISKGKIILILVLVVILAAAATAGVLFFKHYTSPEQQYQRAFESGDDEKMEEIINEHEELRDSETVADTLNSKLDELQRSFLEEKVDYSAAIAEIDRIKNQGVVGTLEKLSTTRSYIETLNASRTAYATAESFFNSENYVEAIEQYKKVSETDPNYSDAAAKIESCYSKYRDKALADAEALTASGAYESAIGLLQSALNVLPNDAKIQEKITLYQSKLSQMAIDDAKTQAKEYAAISNYADAIRYIQPHYLKGVNDYELNTMYAEYTAAYENQIITSADALALERKYDEAIEQVKAAQNLLPDSQVLKDKITALESSRPTPLSSLGPINGGWTWNEGTPEDPFGNSYSGSINFTIQSDHGDYGGDGKNIYAEYRLDGKYTTLTGTLVPYISIGRDPTFQLLVYTDDGSNNYQLVYTSPEIGRKTDAYDFEATIAGAKYVKINIVLQDESAAIVTDLQLWPK